MTGEEYRKKLKEQMKQEFKDDLKKRREFLGKMKELKQSEKMRKAVEGLTFEDDTDEWISKLNEESAFNDAKVEMALDMKLEEEKKRKQRLEDELEMQKLTAQSLVEEMKKETTDPKTEAKAEDDPKAEDQEQQEEKNDKGGGKTLGDW